MKLVVFSDVHGNAVALDAVLADISAQRADTVVLGSPSMATRGRATPS